MTESLSSDDTERFSEALVSEINAERGRQGLSSRGLGALIDQSSQYVSMRLDGGNSKTGKRVTLEVTDLAAICSALNVPITEMITRARRAAGLD